MLRVSGRVTRVQYKTGKRSNDGEAWHMHVYSINVADLAILQVTGFADSKEPAYAPGTEVDLGVQVAVRNGVAEYRLDGDWSEFAPIAPKAAHVADAPALVVAERELAGALNGHAKR